VKEGGRDIAYQADISGNSVGEENKYLFVLRRRGGREGGGGSRLPRSCLCRLRLSGAIITGGHPTRSHTHASPPLFALVHAPPATLTPTQQDERGINLPLDCGHACNHCLGLVVAKAMITNLWVGICAR